MLLGPKAGMLNASVIAYTGQPLFNIFSMRGMILVESFLWIPIVFLADVDAVSLHGPVSGRSRHHRRQHRLAGLSDVSPFRSPCRACWRC